MKKSDRSLYANYKNFVIPANPKQRTRFAVRTGEWSRASRCDLIIKELEFEDGKYPTCVFIRNKGGDWVAFFAGLPGSDEYFEFCSNGKELVQVISGSYCFIVGEYKCQWAKKGIRQSDLDIMNSFAQHELAKEEVQCEKQ